MFFSLSIEDSCCGWWSWCGIAANYVIGGLFFALICAWRTLLLLGPWLKQNVNGVSTLFSNIIISSQDRRVGDLGPPGRSHLHHPSWTSISHSSNYHDQ